MQKFILGVSVVVIVALGYLPFAAESSPNYAQQIALALRTARHADTTARAALSASKRAPTPVKGNDGATGQSGAQGLSGTPGIAGQDGVNGANGANGIAGVQGPKGDQGPQGTAGAAGPTGTSVKAYGHVTASGTGTTTQGTTVTHPGLGSYCLTDGGFVTVVVTPDSWNATAFALAPGSTSNSCGSSLWQVVVSNNSGVDTGFYFVAN